MTTSKIGLKSSNCFVRVKYWQEGNEFQWKFLIKLRPKLDGGVLKILNGGKIKYPCKICEFLRFSLS